MVRTRQSSFVEEGLSSDLLRLESSRSTRRSNYVEEDDSEESGYLPIGHSLRRINTIKNYRKITKAHSKENVNPSPGPSHRTRNATRKETKVLFDGDDVDGNDADEEEGEVDDGEDEDDEDDERNDVGKIMKREGASNGVNGIRRSTRQRKSLYDTLNQSWILGTKIRDFPNLESAMLEESHKMNRKRGRNDNMPEESYDDMYTRIKRQRRKAVRSLYLDRTKKGLDGTDDSAEEGDTEEGDTEERLPGSGWESKSSGEESQDEGSPHPKYDLRRNKPIINRFQVPVEPTRSRKTTKTLGHMSPTHRREHFTSFKSPAHKSNNVQRRRHATHNSSSSSGSSTSSSSEDERRFERRKAKSMARARNRCLPMNFTATDMSRNVLSDRLKSGSSLADIDPMEIDRSVTFDSIGGLNKHLQSLKEMILFPLMYTEVFEKFKITPPRGVLFYGPPGTGKTLVARALANECSQGDHKVAFFMRKGADCLSKWVGESERQLRLLFDQAYCMRPSIIFFDEIDGLAPVRSSRQDQIHSSIVSTLLALMDGLDSRGEVVVIGATNRIDAIDPALRRPGRFDREFNFSLPSVSARKSILKIHTKNWEPPLAEQFINRIAERTAGYCGADLKALCAEVALIALKRRYPQIYNSRQKLQLDVSQIQIKACDFSKAVAHLAPASQRSTSTPGRPLSVLVHPLLHNSLNHIMETVKEIFPRGMAKSSLTLGGSASQVGSDSESEYDDDEDEIIFANDLESAEPGTSSKTVNCLPRSTLKNCKPPRRVQPHVTSHRSRLLIVGQPDQAQSTHLAPAVLHGLEHLPTHKLDLPTLYAVTAKAPEESCAQVFNEARRTLPSVLYLPHVSQWWETLSDTVRATFLTLLHDLEPGAPLLILATSDCNYEDLPEEVAQLFSVAQGEVVEMTNPTKAERQEFFSNLLQLMRQPPKLKRMTGDAVESLPVAPPPEPRKLNEAELQRLEDQEESTLRELRLFLREILYKLARDRRFSIFSKPVDITEVPDYLDVVKVPMDLETMVAKVDTHRYETVAQFLDDVDLICHNALEYNPDRDPSDKIIRHRACALRDAAHALIDAELDPEFEKICQEILESRKRRGFVRSKFAPKNYHTLPRCTADGMDDGSSIGMVDPNNATRFSRRLRGMSVPLSSLTSDSEAKKTASTHSTPHGAQKNVVGEVHRVIRRRGLWFGSCRRRIIRKLVADTPETSDKSFSPRNEHENDSDRLEGNRRDERDVSLDMDTVETVRGVDMPSSEKSVVSNIDSGNEARRCGSQIDNHDRGLTVMVNGEVSSDARLSCADSNRDEMELRSRDHYAKEKSVSEDKRSSDCPGGINCRSPSAKDSCRSPPLSPSGTDCQRKLASRLTVKPELPKVVEIVVDENRLQKILEDLVAATENSTVETLVNLHCRLYRCIVAHQPETNKAALLKDLEDGVTKYRRTPKS